MYRSLRIEMILARLSLRIWRLIDAMPSLPDVAALDRQEARIGIARARYARLSQAVDAYPAGWAHIDR